MSRLLTSNIARSLALLSLLALINAAPSSTANFGLLRRQIEPTWGTGCVGTYQAKVSQAFADAAEIAGNVFGSGSDDTSSFESSKAFSHYFSSGDLASNSMFATIRTNQSPISMRVLCGDAQDKVGCGGGSTLAVTVSKPGNDAQIVLCDRFFSSYTDQTKNDLKSKSFVKGGKRGSWCQSDETFPFFEVAGLTVLHEMTHLDAVGAAAGLSARPDQDEDGTPFTSHGTVDVYTQGSADDQAHYSNMEPWQAARTLHQLWEAHSRDPTAYTPVTPVVESAESYAAAALEYYFMSKCGWDEILPHVDDGSATAAAPPTCNGVLAISEAAVHDIIDQFGKETTTQLCLPDSGGAQIAATASNDQRAQMAVQGTNGSSCASYEDMVTAANDLLEHCNNDGQVSGSAAIPNAPGLSLETYMDTT